MTQCHYTYYSYEEFGRGYIGKRSCDCKPEEDVKYFGSYTDKTFKPTQKIILETYDTREEALIDEVKLHEFYEVDKNPHFSNKAKQTSEKFSYVMTSEEAAEYAKKGWKGFTPEERSEIVRKRQLLKTPEQRRESVRKATEASKLIPTEKRKESARKAQAKRTFEQRSEAAKKAQAKITPEQRSEIARNRELNKSPEERRKSSLQKWKCLESNYVSNAPGLTHYQKARGIDTSNRVRLS
jgi:hypothetical protein